MPPVAEFACQNIYLRFGLDNSCSWAIFAMRGATVVHCVVLLLALTSQATAERRSLVGASVSSKITDEILREEKKLYQKKLIQKLIHGHGSPKSSRHHANGDEKVARAESSHEFSLNPVLKDPVSSALQPGDLEGTRPLFEKFRKLEQDAAALEGTLKLQVYWKKQLDENELLIRDYGANNILRMLQAHDPKCHSVAHQVGRAAVRFTHDITHLLQMCESGCNIGCFHGVIMGLIIDSYDGDFNHISTEEKKNYVSGVLRKMCDESVIGKPRVGTCIHGVGHAAVVASGGHDIQEGMEICMAAFYDDRQKQHHCGTGVSMNEKSIITQDPYNICSKLSLPASCFEYAWAGLAPKMLHLTYGDTESLINFGKKEGAQCVELATLELQEACFFGLGSTISHVIAEDQRHDEDMSEMKSRMKDAVQILCVPLEYQAVRRACMLGAMRYATKWFQPEAADVICSAVDDTTMPDCIVSMTKNVGFSYMDHFAIQEKPLNRAHRIATTLRR